MKGGKIVLNQQMLSEIHTHASSTYPEECCGLLIGRIPQPDEKIVESLRLMKNVYEPSERYHRYTIDPKEFLEAEEDAESVGREVVGIYHSHPNAPSKPSSFDQDHAWPTLSYIVVEIREGKPFNTQSWVLTEDRSEFLEEKILVGAT